MAEIATTAPRDLTRPEFWREAFPTLSLHTLLKDGFEVARLNDASLSMAGVRLAREGYFQERDEALVGLASRLADCALNCIALDIPPVFIFLFDEAWAAFYRQHHMIANFLGADYQMLPDFWAWHVDPKRDQAGWRPHRDKGHQALAADGSPLSLTVWIPLTQASPLNSCMYVLPADRDPVYGTEQDKNWQIDLPSIRALPGSPGDYFAWSQALLHWGGQSSAFAEGPRISMALEFQRADAPPFNRPLLAAMRTLSFEDRLKLISKQIIQYKHMYPLSAEMESLAHKVLALA